VKPLVAALRRETLPQPPVWVMRQAGRYLPEYRAVRERHPFAEAVATPTVAAELTLQPIRRFGMDGAVIFADIMTPLAGMGVDVDFDPGPRLRAHTLDEVLALPPLDPDRVGFVAETIRLVRAGLDDATAVVGFAGAPVTLLAYLLEGGGSRDFLALRRSVAAEPAQTAAALGVLAEAMRSYLGLQVAAGADVVQLFDSWVGLLSRGAIAGLAVPAARASLAGLGVPRIYFAPHAPHGLDLVGGVGADGYGLDWRIPLDEAWKEVLGDVAVQGNLDPAVLLTDPATIAAAVDELLLAAGNRPGHVVNLGHGIDRHTPPEHVAALVAAVRR